MVIRTPDGHATAIDYREVAPGKAHRDMYLDENSEVVQEWIRYGALAVGVPGTVAGTLYALEKYGTMSRQEVIQPAVELAENGWDLQVPMGGEEFKRFESTNKIFNKPDGSRFEVGERFVQKELAETLRLIMAEGRDGFYKGKVGGQIVATMEEHSGLITLDDLERYEPTEREPITGTYRDYAVVSMPPPSSGGITLVALLNILERYDIGKSGWNTAETVHLIVEAERRVFADRNEYIADPEFFDVPVETLISKEYADARAETIDPERATPSEEIGPIDVAAFQESEETTHYSVVDKDGMAVAVTTTIDDSYGSYLVVEGAGFFLNNEMADFSAKVGAPTHEGLVYGMANGIEPYKRMLSSMTPTIVFKDAENFMAIGSPGGPTIITTTLQCIMNVIDHGMTAEEAVSAPRFHHQWIPDVIDYEDERGAFSEETITRLLAMGHELRPRNLGNAQGIVVDPETGLRMGGPDPRRQPPSHAAGH
jgi:gamma-glutamyltranspeptidase/glutathione hydrolase